MEIDPVASHASWMENFPWTRLAGVTPPGSRKPMVDLDRVRMSDPATVRALIGDGNYGGRYQRADEEMEAIWKIAVAETRDLIERPW
jgi:creatinine amidohydrolase